MSYSITKGYFLQLSIENKLIAHNPAVLTQKKFFNGTIEELFSAAAAQLPSKDKGPFIYFVDYVRNIDETVPMSDTRDQYQIMIFFLQGVSPQSIDDYDSAKDLTEKAALQFVAKMNKDSKENHPLFPWPQAFNKPQFKLMPCTKSGNVDYVGFQLSIRVFDAYNNCYNPNDWQ